MDYSLLLLDSSAEQAVDSEGAVVVSVVLDALATRNIDNGVDFVAAFNEALAYSLESAGIPADAVVASIYDDGQQRYLRLTAYGDYASQITLYTHPDDAAARELGFGEVQSDNYVIVRAEAGALPSDGQLVADASFDIVVNGYDAGAVYGKRVPTLHRLWFDELKLSGAKFTEDETRAFGPILWSQYTLSRKVLRSV